MKELIKGVLDNFSINEENQSGIKGNVIWQDDFDVISLELKSLYEIKLRDFAEFITSDTSNENYCATELVNMFLQKP